MKENKNKLQIAAFLLNLSFFFFLQLLVYAIVVPNKLSLPIYTVKHMRPVTVLMKQPENNLQLTDGLRKFNFSLLKIGLLLWKIQTGE